MLKIFFRVVKILKTVFSPKASYSITLNIILDSNGRRGW
jgi:hypothetical protein